MADSSTRSGAGKIFVGGLSWDTTNDGLRNYFCKFGEVIEAYTMRDRMTGRSRGFGFVNFADQELAKNILAQTHVLDGRTIETKMAVSVDDMRGRGGFRTKKIFVGGLPLELTEPEFKEFFEQFGTVTEAMVMLERDTGRPRGFGFITFDSEDPVDQVLTKSHILGGKQIEVKKAQPKAAFAPYAPFGGGRGGGPGGYGMQGGGGYGRGGPSFQAGFDQYGMTGAASYGGYAGYGHGAYGPYGADSGAPPYGEPPMQGSGGGGSPSYSGSSGAPYRGAGGGGYGHGYEGAGAGGGYYGAGGGAGAGAGGYGAPAGGYGGGAYRQRPSESRYHPYRV